MAVCDLTTLPDPGFELTTSRKPDMLGFFLTHEAMGLNKGFGSKFQAGYKSDIRRSKCECNNHGEHANKLGISIALKKTDRQINRERLLKLPFFYRFYKP